MSRWLWQVVPAGIIDAETTADTTGFDVRAKPAEESFATPGATDHSPTKNRLEDYGDRAEGSYEYSEWYQPYSDCGPVETWEQPPKTIEDKHPGRELEHRVSQAPVELNPAGFIRQLGIPNAHRILSYGDRLVALTRMREQA